MEIKIKLIRNTPLPKYQTAGAAAVDLTASIDEPVLIKPGKRKLIPTGVCMSIPQGYVGILASRSGLALKKGIHLTNGIGVIDSDYRGEICANLMNSGEDDFTVNPGERIAQIMFIPVAVASLLPVDTLDETERGEGGFGSTGKD